MENNSLKKVSVLLLKNVLSHTSYEDNGEATSVFSEIECRLPDIAERDINGSELVSKFTLFGQVVATQESFKDMIKIIWRTVKAKSGQPQYKLSLFIIAMAALLQGINSKYNVHVDDWVQYISKWLGNQLTIGGKGVTGNGQGNVVERMSQFFLTPYLHDFD